MSEFRISSLSAKADNPVARIQHQWLMGEILKHTFMLLIILLCCLLLTACGDDHGELKKYVKEVKQRKAGPIQPIPEFKPQQKYTYQGSKHRSPFNPRKIRNSELGKPDANRPKQPLEAFTLDSLKMVGTMQQGRRNWALISAPNGTIYYVSKGSYLGKNYGKVTAVSNSSVALTEKVQNRWGEWTDKHSLLKLSSGENKK